MTSFLTISVDEDDIEDIKKTKDALTCEYSSDMSYEYKLNSQRTEFQWHYAPDEDISVICILEFSTFNTFTTPPPPPTQKIFS